MLRNRLLGELHKSHFGAAKMKALARTMYWWPGLDRSIEEIARDCDICNAYRNNPPKVEVHEWETAQVPFERVHVDYAGPFMNTYFFVLVDAFSKFPFVHIVKEITAKTTIDKCKEIFTNFGYPEIIVIDNGRNFRSTEILKFLSKNKVTPKFTAPYHPVTNGQAERFVQILKKFNKKNNDRPKKLQNQFK